MKVLFAGSPEIACRALRKLAESENVELCGVLTNAPSHQGRGKNLLPTPVFREAEEIKRDLGLNFQIFTPESLTQDFCDCVSALKIDLLVCFAYGKIFRQNFLSAFRLGGINFHPSLLPKFRGPAPIPATILARESETGWTVQRIAAKMDSGNIILQEKFSLDGSETTKSLGEKISAVAGDAIVKAVSAMENSSLTEFPQNESEATFCRLIEKNDAKINWNMSADEIDAQIRAYNPSPVAFTCADGKLLFLHYSSVAESGADCAEINADDANSTNCAENVKRGAVGEVLLFDKQNGFLIRCGKGAIWAKTLQRQTKKALSHKDFFNGNKDFVGKVLGQ